MDMSTMDNVNTDKSEIIDKRCIQCFLRTYNRLFDKFNVDEHKRNSFLNFFNEAWSKNEFLPAPRIQQLLNKEFGQIVGETDPFESEKKENNAVALELYSKIKPEVQASAEPFVMALKLAIAGNVMDYGAHSSFDINATIQKALNTEFAIDHSAELKDRIESAENILYLGDNAGEIVFDRLFIETISHKNLTFAVRGRPILNDVTIEDAVFTGMDKVASVISNGAGNPSTVLADCSKDFIDAFNKADLIISKGQGNLEGLINQFDSRIFFLLMTKCDVISDRLNVKKGSFLVVNGLKIKGV